MANLDALSRNHGRGTFAFERAARAVTAVVADPTGIALKDTAEVACGAPADTFLPSGQATWVVSSDRTGWTYQVANMPATAAAMTAVDSQPSADSGSGIANGPMTRF